MKHAIEAMMIEPHKGGEPIADGSKDAGPHRLLGPFESRNLGDLFGLTQYGVMMETLPPGSKSSVLHWHTRSDEFIMVLEGELTLVSDDGEEAMPAGTVAGFAAGVENARHLVNRSDAPARFLVVGSRVAGDEVHYPHDDLQWVAEKDGTYVAARKDGTPY